MITLAAGKFRVLVIERVYHMLRCLQITLCGCSVESESIWVLLTFVAIIFASLLDSAGWGFQAASEPVLHYAADRAAWPGWQARALRLHRSIKWLGQQGLVDLMLAAPEPYEHKTCALCLILMQPHSMPRHRGSGGVIES